MRIRAMLAFVCFGCASFACASLVGAGDLTCAPDATTGALDTCTAKDGVTILPLSGAINDLTPVNGTIVGVGYTNVADATVYTVATLGPDGLLSNPSTYNKLPSTATGAIGDTNGGYWVVGIGPTGLMLRLYSSTDGNLTFETYADIPTLQGGAAIRDVIGVVSDGTVIHVVGTTSAHDMFFMRLQAGGPSAGTEVVDNFYGGATPLHATAMTQFTTSGIPNHHVTAIGYSADAAAGLVMAQFLVGSPFDTSFGDGGVIMAPFAGGGTARAAAYDSTNLDTWVAGQTNNASGFAVAHVDSNGVVDTTYTAPGTNRGANAIAWEGDKLVVAGFDRGQLAVARFTVDGGLDPSFGEAGVLDLGIDGELRTLLATKDHLIAAGKAIVDGGEQWVVVWLAR